MQSDPIILSAETRLEPGSSSGVNTAALKNPHGLPMELLWVRFGIYPILPDSLADIEGSFTGALTGMVVGVKMDLGKLPIVDSGVPINTFGTARDDWDVLNFFFQETNVRIAHNIYTWRLKHPLYIPPGSTLVPLFQHYGQIPFPAVVRLTYMCRTLSAPKKDKKLWVPWVTSWRSKSFDFEASPNVDPTILYDESSELDIVNPFDVPVFVARFGGRQSLVSPDTNYQNSETSVTEPSFAPLADSGDENIVLSIKSSTGDEIVKNDTHFGGLFPLNLKVWDIPGSWRMEPGEYVKIRAKFMPDVNAAVSGRVQVGVSAVGYRLVDAGRIA